MDIWVKSIPERRNRITNDVKQAWVWHVLGDTKYASRDGVNKARGKVLCGEVRGES